MSLDRKAVLVEAPGEGPDPVVWLDVYKDWDRLISRLMDEIPGEHHARMVPAMLKGWWEGSK